MNWRMLADIVGGFIILGFVVGLCGGLAPEEYKIVSVILGLTIVTAAIAVHRRVTRKR